MNELNAWLEVLAPMVLIVGLIPAGAMLALRIIDLIREAYEGRANEDYKRPVAIEVEKPKLKNEPDDGYGIWVSDDEARELGLAPDWREQIQQTREQEQS